MATFVCAPEIRVRVSPSHSAKAKGQILDISEDLVQGVLNIRTNAVHTFSFQLQNAQRKYDGVLQPMDRIAVEMKRIGVWVRVFSGYLNVGPIFSVWPRVLTLSASCTLKRLQFWYWDPTSAAAVALIQKNLGTNVAAGGANDNGGTLGGQAIVGFDVQATKTVVELLRQVVAWPPEKVHIAAIPGNWYDLAKNFGDEVAASIKDYPQLIGDFGNANAPIIAGTQTAGSGGLTANGSLLPGSYGGVNYSADQANNAAIIYNVAASRGLPAQAAVIAIATAWQESSMTNLSGGDRDSAGLFQQRPSAGWGTQAQVTDPTYAAGKFYDALVKIPNWQSMPVTQAAQAVQRSAFPGAYAKWEATAQAAVGTLSKTNTGGNLGGGSVGANVTGSVSTGGSTSASTSGAGTPARGTARAVASAGFSVIKRSPPGTILYQLGGDDRYDNPNPTKLDCSSFVDWAYYNGAGFPIVPGGRSTAASLAAGAKNVSVATALATKGALVFLGSPGAEHHVELSLGNGYTAAAHTDGIPAAQQVTVSPAGSSWSRGGIMPGINYTDAATTTAAAAELSRVAGITATTSDPNEFGPNALPGSIGSNADGSAAAAQLAANAQANAENFAVNVYTWGLQPANTYGESLVGPLAMMNDSPLLPYIAHLMAGCMRSWCSAPNGDFIAWFPDYFGLFGSAAKMNVRSIELMDFTVEWSDQNIVTHQYVVGSPQAMIDGATANVTGAGNDSAGLNAYVTTKGIATMDFPGIFKVVFGEDASAQFVKDYLYRFGGRPNMVNLPMIASQSRPEFFMALYLFLQRWAGQFTANVPMTFMPELWPGMLLCLPEYNFQAYIMEVQHTFQFGKGGGFNTTAKICAPARTTKKTDIFGLLPLAGSAR